MNLSKQATLVALAISACLILLTAGVSAIEIDPSRPGLTREQIEQFAKGIPDDQFPRLLELLGREDESSAVRSLIKDQKPFPAAKLVEQLSNSKLAVRLGALDLLEDAAGETFGFDAWAEAPSEGGNAEAQARWKAWLEKGTGNAVSAPLVLDEEAFRTLAIEIMSGQRDRAERAMARLDGVGLGALQPIESFLASQPTLEAGPRAALKMAEYRLVLRQAMPGQGAALARELALGSSEAQTTALTALGNLGVAALPVIADFLGSSDPLVRETAADAAFKAGGQRATGLAIAQLREEKAESVIHAILRGLGSLPAGHGVSAAILPFIDHSSENIVTGALEAAKNHGSPEITAAIVRRLSDPRWRVRAAALAASASLNDNDIKTKITERLNDSDLFVRVAAVEALAALGRDEITNTLVPIFEQQHELKPTILKAIFSQDHESGPPEQIWTALDKAPPEVILQCLDTFEGRDDYKGMRAIYAARYANHANRDVSAAALRILAHRGLETGRLLSALTSGDDVKQDAVLDQLQLPAGFLAARGSEASTPGTTGPASAPAKSSALDRLYDFFSSKPKTATKSVRSASVAQGLTADPAKMREVLDRFFREGSPRQRFCAALVLMQQGDEPGAKFLLESMESLSGLDRRAIAGSLTTMPGWPAGSVTDLATRLLRDPADDVREKAIEAWVESKDPSRFFGLLAELVRPGSLLSPDDIYGWEVDRIVQSPIAKKPILDWATLVLADETGRDAHKVLAIILLSRSGQAAGAGVEKFRDSESAWLRRASYRALGSQLADEQIQKLLKDESAMVRAVIPFLAAPIDSGWVHWFDDEHSTHDYEDFDSNRYGLSFGAWAQKEKSSSGPSPALIAALEKLARDPSGRVRLDAQFALLRLGRPIDPRAFAGLVSEQSKESGLSARVGRYVQKEHQRLGKGYAILAQFAEEDWDTASYKKMVKHFGLDDTKAPVSIAEVATTVPAVLRPADLTIAAQPVKSAAKRVITAFRVMFFHKPGCRDCDRVREMLKLHAREFPQMTIEERDINDSREALVNETLSARFRVKDVLHQVTPAVFTQAGAIVREDITFPRLGELLRSTSALAPDPAWNQVESRDVVQAKQTISQRYSTMSFGVVAAAGLLDGVNPCAFATIIFLLSYLQVARRTPREILAVGASFILAVFCAYFVVGLGLAQVLARVSALRFAGAVLNYVLAAFALLVAVMSFRDARLAAQGQLGAMTLQLPGGLKDRIRTVVRSGAQARRFVVAAFVVGIAISLLELACTGQVYLPTILYMLKSGSSGAMTHLVVYNVAFIIPLVIVFALAWAGMRSEALIQFQRRNTALVKVLAGVLFLALAGFLLFGHILLPAISGAK